MEVVMMQPKGVLRWGYTYYNIFRGLSSMANLSTEGGHIERNLSMDFLDRNKIWREQWTPNYMFCDNFHL